MRRPATGFTLPLLGALLALAGCGRPPSTPVPSTAAASGLETIEVGRGPRGEGSAWDGVVESVREARLSAQTSGRVASVAADIDDPVAAGQVLVRITAVEQEAATGTARAQLRAAEAAATEAEANYGRYAALAAGQFVSRAQIAQARAARDAAAAARDAARAQLVQAARQVDYTVVRAPYAGVLSARDVEPGETVAPGQALVTVTAPDALRVEVDVPQSVADAIRRDPGAGLVLADGRRLAVPRVVVYPNADPATHSVTVRVPLPGMDRPPAPGTTARVVFRVAGDAGPPRIPARALVQRGELSGAYRVEDGDVVLRQLRLGRRIGDQVEVLSGLSAGDRVAVDPVAAARAIVAARREAATDGD